MKLISPIKAYIYISAALLLGTALGASERGAAEVFVPEDPEVRILFEKAESLLDKGSTAAASENLAKLSAQLLSASEPGRGSPPSPSGDPKAGPEPKESKLSGSTVISAGAGYSIGAQAAIKKLVERLPGQEQKRWRDLLEPVIISLWERAGPPAPIEDRQILRRRIIRDHPGSSLFSAAVEEEIDEALEKGYRALAVDGCREVLRSKTIGPEKRLHGAVLGAVLSDLSGKDADSREFRAAVKAILEPSGSSPIDAGKAAEARRILGSGPGTPRSPPEPSPAGSGRPGTSEFQLGSVVWRSAMAEQELRSWTAELTEVKEGRAGVPAPDVSLPFFPSSLGGTLFLEDYRRVLALRLPQLQEAWTFQLPPARSGMVNALCFPAPGPELVLVTRFERILALGAGDGLLRWDREVSYDRALRKLRVLPPGMAPPPPAAPQAGPEAGGNIQEAEAKPSRDKEEEEKKEVPKEGDREKDKEKEGKKAEKKDEKQPEQRPVVDLSAPVLTDGGVVFTAVVRIQDEVQLHAVFLDLAGGVRWTTGLGSFRSSDYLGQIAAACPPLPSIPRIFVSSNLGAIAALDSSDGTVLWIQEYPRLLPAGRAEAVRERNRWSLNPLVEREGLLLAAPQDSDLLLALSPEDGSSRFRIPRDRHSTLIGADDERCYLGGSRISAFRLGEGKEGALAWSFSPQVPSVALGRAILSGGRLLVSQNEALVEIEGKSGKVLSTTLWDFRGGGGNILLEGDFLALIGPGEFMVYGDRDQALARSAGLPEEERLLSKAKLDLKRGRLREAFAALGEWARLKPAEPSANSPLYRLRFEVAEIAGHWIEHIAGSREVPDADLASLHRYRVLLEPLPERKMVAAIQAAANRRTVSDFPEAIAHLEAALRLEIPEAPYPADDFLTIPAMEAIRDQLLGVRNSGPEGAAAFASFEARGGEVLREARRIGTQPSFRRVIEWYPFTRAAQEASEELAEYLLNQQNPGEAIRCLLDLLRDNPDARDLASIKLRLADLLLDNHHPSEARRVLQDLLRERGDEKAIDPGPEGFDPKDGRRAPVRDLVRRRLAESRFDAGGDDEASSLSFPLRKRWRSPANLTTSTRYFLRPEGVRPAHLAGTFLTQSKEIIECRRLDDGFPLWTINLTLVPGFSPGPGSGPVFSQPLLTSRFQGDLLLIEESQRNLFALDTRTGRILWHIPFGRSGEIVVDRMGDERKEAPRILPAPRNDQGRGRILPLAETIRGFTSGEGRLFVTTSQRRLLALRLDGTQLWRRSLDFEPAYGAPPEVKGENLVVFREAPVEVHFLDPATGATRKGIQVEKGPDARFIQKPVVREDGLAFLPTSLGLHIVDLARAEFPGNYRAAALQKVWYFPDLVPDQLVLHTRARGLPELSGVDIRSLREIWRYDKLPSSRRSDLSVHCDRNRIYVIHGDEKWSLLAIDLRPGAERGRYLPVPVWPREIPVGTFFSIGSERQILFTQEAILVPDPSASSVMIFDKFKGTNRTFDLARPITRFLRDKRILRFAMDVVDGRLVILASGGDCAFDSTPQPDDGSERREKTALVKRRIEKPDDWDNVGRLASRLFIDGESQTAITLLDRALLSEGLPSVGSPGKYRELYHRLEGIKEEAETEKSPEQRLTIPCRRVRTPPRIDGELNDAWDPTSRIEMRTLRNVGTVPVPGQDPDVWVGEEDLSATLYTGWDDEYFYFAVDVEDSQIFPYDKSADFWKGDCLIIGIDPTGNGGFFQRSDLQLMTLALTVPKRKPPGKDGKDSDDDEDKDEDHKPKGFFSVKKKDDNSGAIYEVALPWSSFRGDDEALPLPKGGSGFGLSLLLTDDDTGRGATKNLSLNPCHLLPRDPKRIWQFLIPEYFPRVVLE